MRLYARTDGPDGERQLLSEHLAHVGSIAGCFADAFGALEWGRAAGFLHDWGKATKRFQDRLDGASFKVDHSTAGAQQAVKIFGQPGRLLAACIAGHHAGLADGKSERDSCLASRLARQDFPVPIRRDELLSPGAIGKIPISVAGPKVTRQRLAFQVSFFVRMLFSCLVDADRLDSEWFTDPDRADLRQDHPSLRELQRRFSKEMQSFLSATDPKPINVRRRKILEDCLREASDLPGLFSLTVPTGGGKTRSSLGFALRHAMCHGMKKIIYVIPFMSIIEQNAAVFRDILGKDAVLEHHSSFDPAGLWKGDMAFSAESHKFELAAENWDAPLIVTTGVQFFESLFSSHPSRCRKLHNIARSVVILDEAQMLPVHLLLPCLEALRELTTNYGTSVVLCTATQPALKVNPEFEVGLANVREIMENPEELYREFKRVEVKPPLKLTKNQLVQTLERYEQVLCIVNTRREAREIFQGLAAAEGTYHLSALMCPEHRSEKIDAIKERLDNELPCRVVSTRLIEAGVDIDFPVVFRAMGGIDSIAQAAGRCNREDNLQHCGTLFVFELEGTTLPPPFRAPAEVAAEVMRKYPHDPLCLAAVEDYFRMLYWRAGDQLDSKRILVDLAEYAQEGFFPFDRVSRLFRLIETEGEPILIPYDDKARAVIDGLRYATYPGSLLRQGQRYAVQVFPQALMKMEAIGAIERLQGAYPTLTDYAYGSFYSDAMGLTDEGMDAGLGALIF